MENSDFLDKEYHPVIEDYVFEYVEDELGRVERTAFEEVLVHDDDLRELAHGAKSGKEMLAGLRKIKAKEGFLDRLRERIAEEN